MPVIRDVMSKIVVSVRPEATLMDAVKVLTKHHVSGVPVVTSAGEVVGFISEPNLMDVLFDRSVRDEKVADHMVKTVHVIDTQDSIALAARMLALYGIRRLPVVENGRFVGVLTRRDLLGHTLQNDEVLAEPLLELIPGLAEYA